MNVFAPIPPPAAIAILAVLCAFVLRVTAGYAIAWLLARCSRLPSVRFAIWLIFMVSSLAYWFVCLSSFASHRWSLLTVPTAPQPSLSGSPILLASGAVSTLAITLQVAALVYLVLLLVFAGAGIVRRIRLVSALRRRIEPGPAVTGAMRQISQQVQAPSCQVWLLDHLTSPASIGWLRPAIYLPADEAAEAKPDLADILRHELCHIRRRDALWDMLSRFARWALFFHPLIGRAFSSLRLERELACDLLVVRSNPGQRHLYADTLVRFGWKTTLAYQQDHIGIGFTSQAAVLNRRVRSILEGERVSTRQSRIARALFGTAACWTAATLLPALWIGFALATTNAHVPVDTVGTLATPKQIERAPRRLAPRREFSAQQSSPQALSSTPEAHTLVYQSGDVPHPRMFPDASAPMSDSSTPDLRTAQERDALRQPGTRKSSLPSGSTVLLDTEAAIAALGHMHGDHGKDD